MRRASNASRCVFDLTVIRSFITHNSRKCLLKLAFPNGNIPVWYIEWFQPLNIDALLLTVKLAGVDTPGTSTRLVAVPGLGKSGRTAREVPLRRRHVVRSRGPRSRCRVCLDTCRLRRGFRMRQQMNITPAPAYMEAVRQVLGIDDLMPSPATVISATRSSLGNEIRTAHARRSRSGAHSSDGLGEAFGCAGKMNT
jgi:hypothetical protein